MALEIVSLSDFMDTSIVSNTEGSYKVSIFIGNKENDVLTPVDIVVGRCDSDYDAREKAYMILLRHMENDTIIQRNN